MIKPQSCIVAAMAAALTCLSTPGLAGIAAMTIGADTAPPIGHYEFCRRQPDECAEPPGKPAMLVVLTDDLMGRIARINRRINAEVTPVSDWNLNGREEYWQVAADRGDCEDYALLKRHRLMAEGIPGSALLMTVVRKRNGEGHAVLTLATTRGDFILDNLDTRIRPFGDVPYLFVKRQDATDPSRWVAIDDSEDLPVAAIEQ